MRSKILAVVCALPLLCAQTKTPVPQSEWAKWESLDFGDKGLSADGAWLVYRVRRASGHHELRLSALTPDGKNQVIPLGEAPAFSADSQFLAYTIGVHEDDEEKLKKDKKPVRKKLGLMKLASGEITTFENIESFRLSPAGAYLAMRHYPPERPSTPPPSPNDAPPDPQGAPLTVRDLAAASNTSFGNVAAFAWQPNGFLLAMTTSTDGKAGNAVQLFDPKDATLRVLDSASAQYHGLTWRRDSKDIAVLRTHPDEKFEDETCDVLVFQDSARKIVFDPTSSGAVPAGMRIMKHRAPTWSENGKILFVGLAPWERKSPPLRKKPGEEEPASVEVWHSRDPRVMSEQKLTAARDRQRSSTAALHLGPAPRLVQLSTNPDERIAELRSFVLALDPEPYEELAMFGRPYHDVYRLDFDSGQRTRVLEKVDGTIQRASVSNTGRYVVYPRGKDLWLCDVSSGTQTNLTGGLASAVFINKEFDHPVSQLPPYGIAGWTKDDRSALVYDEFDILEFFTDGSQHRRLTSGASEQLVHRYLRLDPDERFIDTEKPLYASLFGKWTKRSGFARIQNGKAEPLTLLDKYADGLLKAKDANQFAWVVQAYDDSPDYFSAGPDFSNARRVTETNPSQKNYAWGRSELIEYRSPQGVRLQAALRYPAGYEPGKRYPMIVSFYERVSQQHHRYFALSDRDMYNDSVFTSLGYFVLRPDIVFRPRDPGLSIVECLTAAVNKVLENKAIDPKRVGITGHSWGGYGTVFTSTHSKLFAAAVAGAPLTNLSSSYGEVYWNTGIPETGHAETGQERMDVPVYEDTAAYVRNSATFAANRMDVPLLIAHGDKDGACDLHQSIEMYNAARRAGKQLVLLVYGGENHGLVTKSVRLDYQRRSIEWFGHYLKGEPAPDWITRGVPFLQREKEIKRWKEAKPASEPPAPSN